MNLTPTDISTHEALGITAMMLERARVRRVDEREARDILGAKRDQLAGVAYPYLHPTTGDVRTYRIRRDHPDMERGAPRDKYLSPANDRKVLYFSPDCAATLADPAVLLIVVEAEKSVLAVACAAERVGRAVLAIGLGGCWGWRGRIGKTEDAAGARVDLKGPLDDWDRVEMKGRTVAIAFDANATANPKVRAARQALAKELTGRGALVRLLDLPTDPGVNGPDDYIGRRGAEAFFALLDDPTPSKTALVCGEKGQILRDDQGNIRAALTQLGYAFGFDAFADVVTVAQGDHAGPLDDAAMQRAWLHVDSAFGFRPTLQLFEIVVNDFARQNSHHPVLDYLRGLRPWDGERRLDRWLIDYAGAADTPFTRAVGERILTAAVRRVRQPGVKFDELPVLLGPQGLGKSKLLRALCPRAEWFTDCLSLGDDPKRVIENTRGIWIAEIGELQGTQREVERIKVFLSRAVDGPVRMAYARLPIRAPRKFVCFGSTNDPFFLRDPTGNRRFWPAPVGVLDPGRLERDRDQLWAETVLREATGESLHLPEALWAAAAAAQEAHRECHPWEELLEDKLSLDKRAVTVDATWSAVGLNETFRRDNRSARIIAQVMARHGFVGKKNLRVRTADGSTVVTRCWVKDLEQSGLDEKDVGSLPCAALVY